MDEVLDVEVLRARHAARGMVSLGSPDRPADLGGTGSVPAPVGRPDPMRLWQVVQRVGMSQVSALCGVRWRVCLQDLEALAEVASAQVDQRAGGLTLFGVPVVVVDDGSWCPPELVLVVDRRV